MADLKDERGNPIYLTDQQGNHSPFLARFLGSLPLYVTGVATTVPHLKESSYSGPHPITAPITTTDTPHHAQPISVSHNPVKEHGISSSNSRDEGSGGEGNRRDETKTRVGRHETSTATVESVSAHEGAQEKKSLVKKIKEKLSGHQII